MEFAPKNVANPEKRLSMHVLNSLPVKFPYFPYILADTVL